MENATKEDVENLCKKVHDMTELAKQKSDNYEENVKKMLTDVLKNHPGFTGERKVQFAASGGTHGATALLDSMPLEVQEESDNLFIMAGILGKAPNQLKRWDNTFKPKYGEFKKALDTATAGEGAEWVPTGFSNQLYELVRMKTTVAGIFPQIIMPTNPYKLPLQLGRLNSFKQPEQTANTGQTTIPFGDGSALTGAVTLNAVGHASQVMVSKDVEEDSLIPMLPFLRAEIIRALADGRDDCILNGDVQATHMDSDVTSPASRRKMWDGLRRIALANGYTSDISELTPSVLNLQMRGNLGKYGINPGDLVLITGMKGYMNMLNIPQVMTVDKYGPGATIVTGELAKFMGMPILVSEWLRTDLNAAGVYQSGQSKTVMHAVNRSAFVMGVRREASVQLLIEKYADSGQDALITRERAVFAPVYPVATETTTWMGLNI